MITLKVFDVNKGQSVGVHLSNSRWCLFDAGCTDSFSPIDQMVAESGKAWKQSLAGLLSNLEPPFRFMKATISHLHGDHLCDYKKMLYYLPEFMRINEIDELLLEDIKTSSTSESYNMVVQFLRAVNSSCGGQTVPNYGGASIRELAISPGTARAIGGQANSHVNNCSIVTRTDYSGVSILLCGDVEAEAWEYILNSYATSGEWRPFVSNIDILIAPHHGHASGYSTSLMNLARPRLVIASVDTNNPNVDTRYSGDAVRGVSKMFTTYKLLTTRKYGTITLNIDSGSIDFSVEKGI